MSGKTWIKIRVLQCKHRALRTLYIVYKRCKIEQRFRQHAFFPAVERCGKVEARNSWFLDFWNGMKTSSERIDVKKGALIEQKWGGEIGRKMDNNGNRSSIDRWFDLLEKDMSCSSDFASFVNNRYDFNDDCQERYEDCTEMIHD